MSANPVVNSRDEEPNWNEFDCGAGKEIRKIVIGRTPGESPENPLKITKLPSDLAIRFPNLTHLYLWGIAG